MAAIASVAPTRVSQAAIASMASRQALATGASAALSTSLTAEIARMGSGLLSANRTRAGSCKSEALRARMPTVSRLGESGIAPASDTTPYVGFQDVTPQQCAGMRSEPPVSDPSAKTADPLATATAEPDDDPPVMNSKSHGFFGAPCTAL